MATVKAESFLKLIPASAIALNQPFGLFFSAWVMLEPVRFECVRTPTVRAGKVSIRIVMFGIVRHRFSQLTQQVPVVQAGVQGI